MVRSKRERGNATKKTDQGKCQSESEEVKINLSLPVLSNDNIYCANADDYIMKSLQNTERGENAPDCVVPRIKIRCKALNYERIVDLSNNNNFSHEVGVLKKAIQITGNTITGLTKSKTERNKKSVNAIRNSVKSISENAIQTARGKAVKAPLKKIVKAATQKNTRKRVQKQVKISLEKNSVLSSNKIPKRRNVAVKHSKIPPETILEGNNENVNKENVEILKNFEKSVSLYNLFACATQQSNNIDQNACTSTTQQSNKRDLNSSTSPIQQSNNTDPNAWASTSGNVNRQSSTNLNVDSLITQVNSCSFLHVINKVSPNVEFGDNLEELLQPEGDISDEFEMKLGKSISEINENVKDFAFASASKKPTEDDYSRDKNHSDSDQLLKNVSILGKITLQTAVETFMKNPQIKYLKGSTALKRGLCFSMISNNGVCSNQQCMYNHNAVNLFTRKLKKYPSKFIMSVVVSMRYDVHFGDVVMAAFKVMIERQIPVLWVTFLAFFVFYVVEPSDSRFLKFWARAAWFFCGLQKNSSATGGFASLLAIFSHIENSEQWKIIEFIKLIKQPPVAVSVNLTLLQPVLKMDLPMEFLTAAIESCIATQKDVMEVYVLIVPKIPVSNLPIEIVELLLKLCKTLEELNYKGFADNLKHRLQGKVWSIQTKINNQKFPLTASFQEQLFDYSNEENRLAPSVSHPQEISEMDLTVLSGENSYFHPEEDFCNLMAQALEFSTDAIPKPFINLDDGGERQIIRIRQFFRNYQFDLLGKYLNELRPNVTERAAEEFLKLLFGMKISVEQGVDLFRIIVLSCKSNSASKVIASISVTLILNLVKINDWEKAYTIVCLCEEKQINLVEGKIFCTDMFNTVNQCRIALLLIEIHAYKENYRNAVDLVKKYFLFSCNNSLWQVTWNADDETIRVRILEDLLKQIISKQLTQVAYDLFTMLWKEQKQLLGSVDLRKFVNEMLILLLNQNSEEGINLYEQIKDDCPLQVTTIRCIVVTLVRENRLLEAKSLVFLPGQNAYFTPKITQGSATVRVLSFWLEEEIYVLFEAFFDLLIANRTSFNPMDCDNVEIELEESKPNLNSGDLRPLCLGIITPSKRDACARIQRVLQYQFNPPLKLITMPYYLKLDEFSVKLHLQKRLKNLSI